jgi:hypothetical protein
MRSLAYLGVVFLVFVRASENLHGLSLGGSKDVGSLEVRGIAVGGAAMGLG